MSLVGGNEQQLLGKHLTFESLEWSKSNQSDLSHILGFSQAPCFGCFVDQNLDLLIVFVYREFVFSRKNVKVSEIFTRSAAKKVLFKAFTKFTEKHLSWNLFLIKFIKTLLKNESGSVVFQWVLQVFI